MNFLITLLEFILSLGFLIFLHEFGHFIVARLCKIEVEEFGFGFPPRMVRLFRWGGTDFTLNWIPFGAFVRPKGENDPEVPGGMAASSPWVRLGVLFGGPLMNLITGILLFCIVFLRTGAPDTKVVQIVEVSKNSPAEIAGLKSGDVISQINQEKIDGVQKLSTLIQSNLGHEVVITVKRGGEEVQVKATPRVNPPEGQGSLGIMMGNPNRPITFGEALPYAFQMTYEQTRALVLMPAQLMQGTISSDQARVVGPKGMFDIYQQARTADAETEATPNPTLPAVNTLWLLATISVALGLTNLLPIPALDGGRILFVLPELLFRKRVPAQYENLVHLIGFAVLILLMVYITTQDIINPIVVSGH